jgi:hypothetical protein
MIDDWTHFLEDARTKSDLQLEVEAEVPNELGGNAESRASARVELKRRDRESAEVLALKQLAIAEQQAKSAKLAVLAAWGSAAATVLVGFVALAVGLWQAHRAP